MTDVFWNTDRDACAREAAAAIEAVLDQRCPEMKIAFWSAVEKHYRLDAAPKGPPSVPPKPVFDDPPPAEPR